MANSCKVAPTKVNNNTGNEEVSRLFMGLLTLIPKAEDSRAKVVDLYLKFTNPEFISAYKDSLQFDDLGEPIIGSLLQLTDLSESIDNNKLLDLMRKEFSSTEMFDTIDNHKKLVEQVINFNTNSDYRGNKVADIEVFVTEKGRKLRVVFLDASESANKRASELQKSYNLNNKIRSILQKSGVSVEAYDGLLNELSAVAETEFLASQQAADGLTTIIKLANNSIGEASMTEEFSHFIYDCLQGEPLLQRIENIVDNEVIIQSILGDSYQLYFDKYEGDYNKLKKEAVAKLLNEVLLANHEIGNRTLDTLTERLKNIFKNKFSNMSVEEINRIVDEVIGNASSILNQIENDSIELKTRVHASTERFNDISESIQKDIDILNKIIGVEIKKSYIYDKSAPEEWVKKRKQLIKDLEKHRDNRKYTQTIGIYLFLDQVYREFVRLNDRLNNLGKTGDTILDQSKTLRQIINYIHSYSGILDDIQALVRMNIEDDPNHYNIEYKGEKINLEDIVDKCVGLMSSLNKQYTEKGAQVFLDFLKPFMGQNIEIPFDNAIKGMKKGDIVSAETFYDFVNKQWKSVKDITFMDRWLNAMSNSHDWFNKLFATVVKEQNTKARVMTMDVVRRLQALGMSMEQKGIKDLSFVFERDRDGNLTGNFISEINWGNYRKDKEAKWLELQKKYGVYKELDKETKKAYKKEYKEWINANSKYDRKLGYRVPINKYKNKDFDKLTSVERDFYDKITGIKEELDAYLPISGQARHQVPIIMKDLLERVKSADGLKGLGMVAIESLKDEVMRRGGDVGYGTDLLLDDYDEPYINRPLDFDNNPIERLPIYYQKLRSGDNINDISTDIISTMCAYAQMANNYRCMNEVIDAIEVGRDLLDNGQTIQVSEGGIPVIEKINHLGHSVLNTGTSNNSSNIKAQRDDWFLAHVYGRYFANAGTMKILGKMIDLNKLANLSNKLTSLNGLAFNPLAGIANIDQGVITMNIEAVAREFFDEKNLLHADIKYAQLLPEYLAEVGERIQTSDLALFSQEFNVLQDYDREVQDIKFDRRNWLGQMFGSNFLYVINNAGEHWMQHRTFFSLIDSDNEKLTDSNGNKISILEAYDKKFIQEDGSLGKTDVGLGAKLVMKTGIKTADGLRIITNEELAAGHEVGENEIEQYKFTNYFSRKCAAINQRMHGIYNTEDMNAFQRLAVGRMVMIFRKWIVPSIEKRYDTINYNFDTKTWHEGYYRTSIRVVGRLISDIKKGQFVYATFKDELTDMEKENLRRCLTEVSQFVGILVGIELLGMFDDDDATEQSWWRSMMEYKLMRMRTEIGALVPNHRMLTEIFTLIQTPTADVRLWQTSLDLLNLLNPVGWSTDEEDVIQSGKFKGHSRNYKHLHNSVIMPFENDIYNILHPIEAMRIYK